MRALRLFGVALTTMRVIDTLKEGLPIKAEPALKSTVAVVVAAAVAYPLAEDWREHLLLAGAGAGLASLLHDAQWLAQMMADSYQSGITRAATRASL